MTVEELLDSYDWAEVFGEGSGINTDKSTDAVGDCPPDPAPDRAAVAAVLASRDGENDESAWMGVFLLKDGRYLYAEGSCDYTGWDCQAGNSLTVARTLRELVIYGLTDEARREFRTLSAGALWPACLSPEAPFCIAADWHEENGNAAASACLCAMSRMEGQ